MKIKNVGVLTSGGDAPGMNAAIRAVVRAGVFYNVNIWAIYQGYSGLLEGNIKKFNERSVSKILGRGGTILKTSRCEEFKTIEGRQKAADVIKKHKLDALVVIGGNGSLTGAHILFKEHNIPVIGIPATIDNDLPFTDFAIGFDTATNIVVEGVDRIRDTASSHDRLFFIEVMGRDSGWIAIRSGIATGAICTMIPEKKVRIDELIAILRKGYQNNKSSSIVIVAEGNSNGSAFEIADKIKDKNLGYDVKVTVLGHLQRGGAPSCQDRILASELGVAAMESLLNGEKDVMVGLSKNKVVSTPLEQCISTDHPIADRLMHLSQILSI